MSCKYLKLFGLIALLLACVGCASSGANLVGTWEMLNDQGEPTGAKKVLSEDHFGFGTMRGERGVWAGGGTWKVVEDIYFETVEYHSMRSLVGRTLQFKIKLEDGLWHHQGSFHAGGMDLNVDEMWRRVEGD